MRLDIFDACFSGKSEGERRGDVRTKFFVIFLWKVDFSQISIDFLIFLYVFLIVFFFDFGENSRGC